MKLSRFTRRFLLIVSCISLAVGTGRTQSQTDSSKAGDADDEARGLAALAAAEPHAQTHAQTYATAPARAARLTFFAGAVQIRRPGNTGEDTPMLNLPLAEGTVIVTADYGQAEIEFEDGSVARLTPRSSLSLATLTLDSAGVARTRLTLLDGLAYFELRKASNSDYLVEAAGTQAAPLENLTLRVNLDQPPALFAVLGGAAQLTHSEDFRTQVRAGETLRADLHDPTRYFLSPQIVDESWDQWNQSRDQAAAGDADRRTSARDSYAGGQGYGWSDLDAAGTWYDVPGLGPVWQPAAARNADYEDFDPYSNGAWVWSSTGYVWASAYSWGWTPFRCGFWAFYPGFGWAWSPNAGCSRWGFAGYGGGEIFIYVDARRPPRHHPVPRPEPPPGHPHPILPVRPPERPPVIDRPVHPIGAPVSILAWKAVPLKPVGGTSLRNGSHLGPPTLDRDFPVDPKTHQPVLGTLPGTSPVLRVPVTGQPVQAGSDKERGNRPGTWPSRGNDRTPAPISDPSPDRTSRPGFSRPGPRSPAAALPPPPEPPAPVHREPPVFEPRPAPQAPERIAPSQPRPSAPPPPPARPAPTQPMRSDPERVVPHPAGADAAKPKS